jgi:hypothetical protein
MSQPVPNSREETRLAADLDEQFKRFDYGKVFKSDIQRLLLRELLTESSQRRFQNRDSGINIVMDCYEDIYARKRDEFVAVGRPVSKRFDGAPPKDPSSHPGKKTIARLRVNLANYYRRHTSDPIKIKVPKGEYWPVIHGRGPSPSLATSVVEFTSRESNKEEQPAVESPRSDTPTRDILRAFDEFVGISNEDHTGVIILQSDLVDDLLQRSDRDRRFAQASSRLYKARNWINSYDTRGALALQEMFQKLGRKVPKLILNEHRVKETHRPSVAFRIAMGLGFSDETTKTIQNQVCDPWMRISRTSGDAVSLRKSLLLSNAKTCLEFEPDSEKRGFHRLLPCDWNKSYVTSWEAMLPPTHGPEVRDYAMIFRHTQVGLHRHVLFVVAGFTERSTEIGAQYLTNNWPMLWKRHVKGRAHHGPLGDFLVMIEGPSDPDRSDEWIEDRSLEITPERLQKAGIDCAWADRITDKRRRSGALRTA